MLNPCGETAFLSNLTVFAERNGWTFELQVILGEISPEHIQVQLYADPVSENDAFTCLIMRRCAGIPGALNGFRYKCNVTTTRHFTDFTPRVVAYHTDALVPIENNLILWWSGEKLLSKKQPDS